MRGSSACPERSRRDPQLGRFLGVDPLADAQGQQVNSPYAAMGNAPESMVDPNGLATSYASASLPFMIDFKSIWFGSMPNVGLYMPGGELFNAGKVTLNWGDGLSQRATEAFWNQVLFTAKLTSGNTTIFSEGAFSCNFGGGGANSDGGSGLLASADDDIGMGLDVSSDPGDGDKDKAPAEKTEYKQSWISKLEWKLNRGMEKNWIGDLAGPESSWEGSDGFKNKGLPTMKATLALNLTIVTGGMGGLGFVTYGNIAFAADNLMDVGTSGKYSVAALSKKGGVFGLYNTLSVAFGVAGIYNSSTAFMRNPTASNYFLKASDASLFMYYWAPSTINGIYNYNKK